MPNITAANAQGWLEPTKLTFDVDLDTELEAQIADEVYGRLNRAKDANPEATPSIVRSIIAMRYASAYIDRVYAEDDEGSPYAARLWRRSTTLLEGVITGAISLGEGHDRDTGPSSYPTDLEEPAFTMGQIF